MIAQELIEAIREDLQHITDLNRAKIEAIETIHAIKLMAAKDEYHHKTANVMLKQLREALNGTETDHSR